MSKYRVFCLAIGCVVSVLASSAQADIIISFYGDDDGFGFSPPLTSGSLPGNPFGINNQEPGEAPFTDRGLIADGFSDPAFRPTGNFDAFVIPAGEIIFAASLGARFGSFDPIVPLQPPNRIFLDGALVSPAFFLLFTDKSGAFGNANNAIETVMFSLDASFFPLLLDGTVNLSGTLITEGGGSGSFMVDFLRLDITTVGATAVPEPGSFALVGIALAAFVMIRRRKTA